jgi:hypothetical protein
MWSTPFGLGTKSFLELENVMTFKNGTVIDLEGSTSYT